jgi:hypothetical protein
MESDGTAIANAMTKLSVNVKKGKNSGAATVIQPKGIKKLVKLNKEATLILPRIICVFISKPI